MLAIVSSIFSVIAKVFTHGCFIIRRMTPSFPLMLASPLLFALGPKATFATSCNETLRVSL